MFWVKVKMLMIQKEGNGTSFTSTQAKRIKLLLDFVFKFMSSEQITQVKAFQFANNNSADFSGSLIELKTMCSEINHRVMQAVHDLEYLRNKNTQLKKDSRIKPAPIKSSVTAFVLGGRIELLVQQKYVNLLAGLTDGLLTRSPNHTE